MILFGESLVLAELVLLVYCALDIATTPRSDVRQLPKAVWLLLVLLVPLVGGTGWLVVGRPRRTAPGSVPDSAAEPLRQASPDDDDAFLASLRARTEAQRAAQRRRQGSDGPPPPDPAGPRPPSGGGPPG